MRNLGRAQLRHLIAEISQPEEGYLAQLNTLTNLARTAAQTAENLGHDDDAIGLREISWKASAMASDARSIIMGESMGAHADEELLYDAGWYPLDDRFMTWAHTDMTEGEPIDRVSALRMLGKDFDWSSGDEWSNAT